MARLTLRALDALPHNRLIVDYFDDEPRSGRGYEASFQAVIDDPDGIPRRIFVRWRGPRFERVSVTLEEIRGGEIGSLMRYDDAHGRYHRHVPGWPEPSREIAEYLDGVPKTRRVA